MSKLRAIVVMVSIAVLLLAMAGKSATAEDLPEAMIILLKNIEARGGAAAYQQISNMKVTYSGQVAWHNSNQPARPLAMEMTIYQEKPNLYYQFQRAESIEGGWTTMEYGTNGDVVWGIRTKDFTRAAVITGEDRANALVDFHFPFELQRSPYKGFKTSGIKTINGKECYEVIMEPAEGTPRTAWFDKKDFNLAAIQWNHNDAFMPWPYSIQPRLIKFDDYKKVKGVMVAHKMEITMLGWGTDAYPNRTTLTIKNVEVNIDMPKDRFDLPPKIKAILKTRRGNG